VTELSISRCRRCGTALFPCRLRCPYCGGRSFKRVDAGEGLVEQETTVRHMPRVGGEAVRLGSVRLVAGPVVIARLDDGALVGTRVCLSLSPGSRGAVWARPAKP